MEELGNPGEPSWETLSGWAGTRNFLEETYPTSLLIPSPVQFSNPSSLTNYTGQPEQFHEEDSETTNVSTATINRAVIVNPSWHPFLRACRQL